jgi:hypothetical protein
MNRSELGRRLVLNSISDDYENVGQVILWDVAEDGAKCGLTIERSEIVDALGVLIEDGLAKAYLLSGTPCTSLNFAVSPQWKPCLRLAERWVPARGRFTQQFEESLPGAMETLLAAMHDPDRPVQPQA